MVVGRYLLAVVGCLAWLPGLTAAEPRAWPRLPEQDGAVELPAQEWPLRPGPRTVRVLVRYPGGALARVTPGTGLMLSLHNWGGSDFAGTADPRELADRLNLVVLGVNYLQSGKQDAIDGPEPYDFGYLQALDALRALAWAFHGLRDAGRPFAAGRLYSTGGSGGGNVTLMANKLAPRTFACVIDLCGMKKLSDDIAFHLPGGSSLNARYSRDPTSRRHLTLDHQEIRFIGNPDHLATMRRLGATARIVVVHGVDDATCPFADAEEMVFWMRRAGLAVEPHFIARRDLDGKTFTSTGHPLGNRTRIVFQVAGAYLEPGGPQALVRQGPCDFERRDQVRYRTSGGTFVISYAEGYPVARFEPAPAPVAYPDPTDLGTYRDAAGTAHPVRTAADWEVRRQHVLANVQRVMGPFPSPLRRVPLAVQWGAEERVGNLRRRKLTFQSDPDDRVPAYLFLPAVPPTRPLPAVLCLHQTTPFGKDEPAGVRGQAELRYALELAERGYVTLAPDYPSLGEHAYDFDPKHGYASGSMKALWDNVRALDLLETLPEVDAGRLGVIGHSLGGHNALFTALFEPRLRVVVSSCGFTTFRKDDLPSWSGPRYMPRLRTVFGHDVAQVPFDFHELVAALAPRPFLACAATGDDDFDVTGVRAVMAAARSVYALLGAGDRLAAYYPNARHSFPLDARQKAYAFLDQYLQP